MTSERTVADRLTNLLDIEEELGELWMEALQIDKPPIPTDNFFSLGGDSMAMVALEFRIKEEFSVELPAGSVLGAQTLRELATVIDAASGEIETPVTTPIRS